MPPAGGGADLGEPDRDAIHGPAGERGPDDVVQPAIALLVRREHSDGCRLIIGARFHEFLTRLLLDLFAELGWLAQASLDRDGWMLLALLERRDDLVAKLRPELRDL